MDRRGKATAGRRRATLIDQLYLDRQISSRTWSLHKKSQALHGTSSDLPGEGLLHLDITSLAKRSPMLPPSAAIRAEADDVCHV